MQLEKCTDYRVGRKKSYYFMLQKGLIQTAKCVHFENVLGLLTEQQPSHFMPLLYFSPLDPVG